MVKMKSYFVSYKDIFYSNGYFFSILDAPNEAKAKKELCKSIIKSGYPEPLKEMMFIQEIKNERK